MEWNWWILALLPAAWLLRNCWHEGSHLLMGWLHEGRPPKGWWPYPHKVVDERATWPWASGGKFYFARCAMGEGNYKEPYYQWKRHLPRHIAPVYADLLTLVSLAPVAIFLPHTRLWLLPAAICAVVDALWFWRGYFWGSSGCDGKRWRYGATGTAP